jgi:hypothetical protein
MPGIDDIGRIKETLDNIRSNIGTKPRRIFYVDSTNGNDNYDGRSPARPVHSINIAIGLAGHGDVIHIARDTYDEAVSIPAGKNGLQIICEPGVYIVNTTPGTVAAIASDAVYWQGGILETNGQIGLAVNGDWFIGKNIRAYNCLVGFDMNGRFPTMIDCKASLPGNTGFDISQESGFYIDCLCSGQAGVRGFYLSHMNALANIFMRCATQNCSVAGYQTVALASGNLFVHCAQSALCAGPVDAGGSTFASHSMNSQITAGNSLQQDLATIETYVDEVESRLTAARAGYLDGIPRILCSMDFWSDSMEEVTVTNVAGDIGLPDVTVADLPAGAIIVRAIAMFKFRMVEETSGGANGLNANQNILVRDDSPSAWIAAVAFVDNQFTLAASAREGGDAIIGAIDVSATVDGNDDYNFQWDEAWALANGIKFSDIQVGIRIWFSI